MSRPRTLFILTTALVMTASRIGLPNEPLQQVIASLRAAAAELDKSNSAKEWRVKVEEGTEELTAVADDIKIEPVKIKPANADDVDAEWVIPPNSKTDRVVMYLHGGGYIMCSARFHRATVARLARASRARALNVDYRLAPEAPYPAAVDDATAAYRWLLSSGVKPKQIVIAGDSAGGGLTLATLVNLRNKGVQLPAAAVCISPWVDLAMTGKTMTSKSTVDPFVQKHQLQFMARNYLQDVDPHTPLASPLYADLRGLPPLLIHVGSAETLLSDSTRIAEHAGAANVDVTLEIWKDMIHSWHLFAPILPEGQQAIDRVGEFIRDKVR